MTVAGNEGARMGKTEDIREESMDACKHCEEAEPNPPCDARTGAQMSPEGSAVDDGSGERKRCTAAKR